MTSVSDSGLERLLLHVALPPLRLGVRFQRLKARRADPKARSLAERELRLATMIRLRLARAGWWKLDARGRLLRAALGFLGLDPRRAGASALTPLLRHLAVIGHVVAGMARREDHKHWGGQLTRGDSPELAQKRRSYRRHRADWWPRRTGARGSPTPDAPTECQRRRAVVHRTGHRRAGGLRARGLDGFALLGAATRGHCQAVPLDRKSVV